jgi:hypothetical protein
MNTHLQAKFYIHLVDLHNEYLRTVESHVALQYFGNKMLKTVVHLDVFTKYSIMNS